MNVVLKKEIALKSAEVYLKLQRKVERKDIQKYLQGDRFNNSIIENRVPDYLKQIKIYDEQYHLTPYGDTVKETGMVNVLEEGKYKIYFTQNDSHFGNKIFLVQRMQPRYDEKKPMPFRVDFGKEIEQFCLSSNKNDGFRFVLRNTDQDLIGIETLDIGTLMFSWEWEEMESSVYIFNGRIKGDNISGKPEKCDDDLPTKIAEILHDWNRDSNRYKIPFNVVNDEDRLSFNCVYQNQWNGFDIHIDKLPIEPYDNAEARLWRNYLLNVKLSEDYLNPKDFENVVREQNDREGFCAYKNALDVPAAKNYSDEIGSNTVSKRGSPYWHLVAPLDLNPGIPEAMIRRSISYAVGRTISFKEIAKDIYRDAVEKIFYYDKYVVTQRQQKCLNAFFEAFTYNSAYLITDTTKNNRSDYIEKQSHPIVQKNMNNIFKTCRPQHDRYLILSVGAELKIWAISNSLDYVRFDENNISATTNGKIEQSVIFTNVEETMLFPELLQFIKEEIKHV